MTPDNHREEKHSQQNLRPVKKSQNQKGDPIWRAQAASKPTEKISLENHWTGPNPSIFRHFVSNQCVLFSGGIT